MTKRISNPGPAHAAAENPTPGQHPFAPVWDAQCRILVLGSYPSPQSRAQGFFYGHPRNRFWPLMASLLGQPLPQQVEEKRQLLLGGHIALWDVLASCSIQGAADSSIRDPVPTDLSLFLQNMPLEQVFCNGATAFALFRRFHPDFPLGVQKLPSTSPANAACTLQKLEESWRGILPWLGAGNGEC